MAHSAASVDTNVPVATESVPPAARGSLFERILYAFLAAGVLAALTLVVVGGLALSKGDGDGLTSVIVGAVAVIFALAGSVLAWRGALALAGWMLVGWALTMLAGGVLLVPDQRSVWFVVALAPAICAMLFLPVWGTALAALAAIGLVWGLNLFILAAPSAAQQADWLMLTLGVAMIALLLLSGSALVRHLQRRLGKQAQVLQSLNQKVSGEQDRSERAGQQWAVERDRLAAVLDATPDGIVLADPNGAIVTANAAARQLLNETAGSALEGQKLATWTRDIPGRSRVVSTEREGDRQRILLEYANGHIISLSQVPIRSTSGEVIGLVGLFHDQTDALELEQMRSQFLTLLVQDMQDPLTSILASQDALLAADLGEGNERVLTAARRSTTRLLDLVQTLLEMHRLQNDQTTLHRLGHPLRPLVESSIAQTTPIAQQRAINLVMEYGADGGPIQFDADKMRRVMLHLLDNALKHSPAYSTIRIQANQSNGLAQVRISDQGPGIAPEYAHRIFDRFGKGVGDQRTGGLGLAFCKLVIEAHGGRIWVESSPGKGSTFAFSLPA
jgi:NtrC-family two-component system sensor histidine kinase KinB